MSEATQVCARRKEHEWDSCWLGQSRRVLSQSPLAMQLLKMSPGMVAAKGDCLSHEPKCHSYYANPIMPRMVCYRQSYFPVKLFLKASLMESCRSRNTCATSSSVSACCTTWFQKQKCCIKMPEEKGKHSYYSPSIDLTEVRNYQTVSTFQEDVSWVSNPVLQ